MSLASIETWRKRSVSWGGGGWSISVCVLLFIPAIFVGTGCGQKTAPRLDLAVALHEMASLDHLAVALPWRCYLASSYDRGGGNEDKGQFKKILPNGRKLILDAKGPGCVQRLWGTGMSDDDRLFFFFDGEKSPRLNASLRELVYWRKRFPFVTPFRPVGSGVTYFPLPFQKSLRIEAEGPKPIYYQVTWRKFPKGRAVESYPESFSHEQTNMIVDAGARWNSVPSFPSGRELEWHTQELCVPVGYSGRVNISGSGTIREFAVELSLPDSPRILHHNVALRRTQLRMTWGRNDEPSVNVPLGPFFCNAWRESTFESQPMSSSNGVYTCRFPMPFTDGASLEVKNGGMSQIVATIRAGVDRSPFLPEDIRYFHANWNSSQASGAEARPHTVLDFRGRGHYVGCSLNVESGQQGWLVLEGDETIRIDGEKKPSHLGTGLEDYFNDCWYYLHGLRDHPWHGLLEFVPYRSHQYRFHNVDAIPFRKSFHMTFERGDASRIPARFESVAYWYADRPSAAPGFSPSSVGLESCGISEGEAMAALISLERASRYRDAERLCRQFTQDHPKSAFRDAMGLREEFYRSMASGDSSVPVALIREQVSKSNDIALMEAVSALRDQADRALLGFQPSTKGRLYLDGEAIADATGHLDYVGRIVDLSPGRHVISIELDPTGHERWLLVTVGNPWFVRGGVGDPEFYVSGWIGSLKKPEGWPSPRGQLASSGVKMWPGTAGLPRPPYVVFRPNMLACMQSGNLMIIGADPHQRSKLVYLTKTFEWPGEIASQ